MSRNYNLLQHGPEPEFPFLLVSGLAAVVGGAGRSITLAPGVIWPGTARLPADLMAWLNPDETYVTEGAEWAPWDPSPREVEFTSALVLAQVLRDPMTLVGRIEQLSLRVDLAAQSHHTLAALVGSTRESAGKVIRERLALEVAAD